MRKVYDWVLWIISTALLIWVVIWGYRGYTQGNRAELPEKVPEYQTHCSITADTGQCVCHHRESRLQISIGYDECVSRARNQYP
jgi:hypothetical protein